MPGQKTNALGSLRTLGKEERKCLVTPRLSAESTVGSTRFLGKLSGFLHEVRPVNDPIAQGGEKLMVPSSFRDVHSLCLPVNWFMCLTWCLILFADLRGGSVPSPTPSSSSCMTKCGSSSSDGALAVSEASSAAGHSRDFHMENQIKALTDYSF